MTLTSTQGNAAFVAGDTLYAPWTANVQVEIAALIRVLKVGNRAIRPWSRGHGNLLTN
jgi:hypothetical protein